VPELETRLQYCLNNFKTTMPDKRHRVEADLALIKREVQGQLEYTNQSLPAVDKLSLQRFDSTTFDEVTAFLEKLKHMYINRYNRADEEKERIIFESTGTPELQASFNLFKESYENEAIADLVKNTTETHRIVERDGKLIQKIYPVYKDPDPDHPVDFDAQFYMPAKHFLNRNIDTFYFNTGVIWTMSLIFALALYYDVLRRIIDGLGNLSNPMKK
jgi:hypothetical protein